MVFSVASYTSTLGPAARLVKLTHYESVTLVIIDLTSLIYFPFQASGVQDSYHLYHPKVARRRTVPEAWTFWALYSSAVVVIPTLYSGLRVIWIFYGNLSDPAHNENIYINGNSIYTPNETVQVRDNIIVWQWNTTLASIVALMVVCCVKRDLVLQIPDFFTYGNLFHVNYANMFVMRRMFTINERRNLNMPTMRISQNSDKFVRIVEQFTY